MKNPPQMIPKHSNSLLSKIALINKLLPVFSRL